MAALDRRLNTTISKGYQPGSAQNLKCYINRYLDFCIEHKVPPVPAQGKQLRRFIQYLSEQTTINAIQTVNNYIWGLKTFHRILDLPPPDTTEFLTKLALKGLRLTLARPIKQAEPITPEIFMQMFRYVNIDSDEQVAAWTALLYTFHMLLHKSNLVPNTQNKFDPDKQISSQRLCMALNSILVEVVWCKNMQFKEKILPFPLIALDNKVICPVHWTWILIQRVGARPTDPLFCYKRRGKFMILTYPRLTYWFKRWLDLCSIESKAFTMHSCRRGGCSFLFKANVTGQVIKLLGNWASDVYLRYIDVTLGKRVEAACQFANPGRSRRVIVFIITDFRTALDETDKLWVEMEKHKEPPSAVKFSDSGLGSSLLHTPDAATTSVTTSEILNVSKESGEITDDNLDEEVEFINQKMDSNTQEVKEDVYNRFSHYIARTWAERVIMDNPPVPRGAGKRVGRAPRPSVTLITDRVGRRLTRVDKVIIMQNDVTTDFWTLGSSNYKGEKLMLDTNMCLFKSDWTSA